MTGPVTALGDVVTLRTGPFGSSLHKADYVVGGIPLINPTHIQEGRLVPEDDVAVGEEKFAELRDFALEVGDVVMGRPGEMGRCAVVTHAERGWLCGTGSIIVRPRAGVDPEFLQRFLASPATVQALERDSVGTTMVNLNQKILLSLKVALPSLKEQRRIAEILGKVDALRGKRRETIAKLDLLLQSVFLDMFGDPVSNPKGWPLVPFTEVGEWKSGATPSKSESIYWDGTFPWVSPKDMKVEAISDAQDHVSELAFEATNLKRIDPGHLLIVVRGMILAHSFPTALNIVPVAINQDMKAIEPAVGFDVVYLKAAVDSLKQRILSAVSSAGHGTCRLSTQDASSVMVPMPPKSTQEKFKRNVNVLLAVRAQAKLQTERADQLFAALQMQAFTGAL